MVKKAIANLPAPATTSLNKPMRLFAQPGQQQQQNYNALIRAMQQGDGFARRWGLDHFRTQESKEAVIRELVHAKANIDYLHPIKILPQNSNPFSQAIESFTTPLLFAINSELADQPTVKLLLDLRADPAVEVNEPPLTALHYEVIAQDIISLRHRDCVTTVRTHYAVCSACLFALLCS